MQDHHADLIGRSRKRAKTLQRERENVTTDEAGAPLRDADDKQTAVRASSERDEVMAWGDEVRCEGCGKIWVEPSKNSMKKSGGVGDLLQGSFPLKILTYKVWRNCMV